MIYARVDVNFGDHPKALAAGAVGRDLWTWGLLYARKHELDGELPKEAVLTSCWGAGGRANAKVAAKLVAVGLWAVIEGGWHIVNYAEKNETRSQIDQRRSDGRERKSRHDANRRGNALPTRSEQTTERVTHNEVTQQNQIQEPEPDLPPKVPLAPRGSPDVFVDGTPDLYRSAMSAAMGAQQTALTPWEAKDLAGLLAAHAAGKVGQELAGWLRTALEEFAVSGRKRFGARPKHVAAWLDAGRPADAVKRPARPVQTWTPQQAADGDPLFTDEEKIA